MRRPPVLLTNPDYCGTLAAARCLGAAGFPVWMAGTSRSAPAMHSRYVTRTLTAPPLDESGEWLRWARTLGAREVGAVLYPTSDDFAWYEALHAPALDSEWKRYAPRVEVYETLLDKVQLHAACARVGLETPATVAPDTDEALEQAAREVSLPVLIKQRTQLLSRTNTKGVRVTRREDLVPAYRAFVRQHTHGAVAQARLPNASRPMLQAFLAEGISGDLQLTGFVDRSGELFVARAAKKVLSRPRTLGISLCLEAVPLEPELVEKVRALLRDVGYFGVFAIEFIRAQGRWLLIDFNPRYYHFMALDLARGMPLPLMATLAALGEDEALAGVVRAAQEPESGRVTAFTYRAQLVELLAAQTLARKMPLHEVRSWWQWYRAHEGRLVDAVAAVDDPRPQLVDLASTVKDAVRHPRSYLRQVVFDS